MSTDYVQDHQGSGGHKAEHRHKHHPALGQGQGYQGGGNQDPHQASKDLQGGDRGGVLEQGKAQITKGLKPQL